MPDWVIRSKLHPQVRRRNLVARNRLIERLDDAFESRLVLVHAPAGYGKSTCLAQWRDTLQSRDVPVAWLSLDEHDAELFQFQTYVSESCVEAGFSAGRDFPRVSEKYSVLSAKEVSAALVVGFTRCKGSHVLILDDFHRAQSPEVSGFVEYLLSTIPDNIHIVMSTRELPSGLSLADLRIHDDLIEITQDNLRFSDKEIRTYLDFWVDSSASDDWSRKLHDRTEGWPVALQTVRRWTSTGTSIEETLTQLSGRTSDLSDYFLEQVFNSLSQEARRFLLATSILERVNGDVGGALCVDVDGWAILQDLDQKDLFVQSLDRQRIWYRYHRLFSEFLQERLRRSKSSNISELHRLASDWFRQHGQSVEAVQHALASGNVDTCAALLESLGGWHYVLQGHLVVVQNVLAKIGEDTLRDYPRVWLAKIYLAIRLGKTDSSEAELKLFKQRYGAGDLSDSALYAEATVMSATVIAYSDKPVTIELIQGLEKLGETIPLDNNVLHAARSNMLCAWYRDVGRFDECMAIGDQAISHYRAMGSLYGEAFIYFHEGLACLRQARLRDAESLYKEGFEIAVDVFGDQSDLAAIGRVFLAEVSYEKNRLHDARQLLESSIRHIEKADAWSDVYLAAYLTLMKLSRALKKDSDIDNTVFRARSTAIHRGIDRLESITHLQRLELALIDEPTAELMPPVTYPSRPFDEISRQFGIRIRARQMLAALKYSDACDLLQREIGVTKDKGMLHFGVSLSVLLAAARWMNGEREAAISAFESALSVSIFEGIKRPFIDEGELVHSVIYEVSKSVENRRGNRLRDSFIAELIAEIDSSRKYLDTSGHILSPREREVLRCVMQGQSNREVAEALTLSVNTVKFHLKNIFEKLGVSSRKDAVSMAVRQRVV
ncbi:MAG: LuxR C-terminal-related transcriptional regulator [Gammaproteobacteria bacterium]